MTQVPQALRALLDQLATKGRQARKELLVTEDLLEPLDILDSQDQLVRPVSKEIRASLVTMDSQGIQEEQACQDLLDRWELPESKARQDMQVQLVPLVQLVVRGYVV